MQPRVTAILVARNGAQHLERTLEALRGQTRQPDAVITVDCGSTDGTAQILAGFPATHYLSAPSELTFGQAINAALGVIPAPASDHETLWLIAQDSAPEPTALATLLGELEISPSVAVAGPKVMEWDAGDYINNFGLAVTPYGSTVTLVQAELDQGQHDGISDVLAVSAGGMLVRHTVWNELGGFDPALPVVDDSLDFCVRVRLAGYRVSVVAAARVVSAEDGVAGPNGSSRGRARRKRLRATRAAQLHRRLVYAPGWAVPLHWLSLVPLALVRSIGQLLRKEPGSIVGEFSAAFATAFSGMGIRAARRRLAATKRLSWAALAPLRISAAEVRRRHALTREASLAGYRGTRPEIHFMTRGGSWTTLAAALLGVILLAPFLGARTLTGGGLLPLDGSVAGLWASTGYGWRDIGLGFVGAADPFASVLAVLGTLTFWQPSFALVMLYFVAFPLAAAGAWMAATRLTERPALRATAAVLWVFAPTFLSALATGRPAAILVHLLLPWLFFAGAAAARSWSASASASLLFAAVVACAPSLAPALLVVWLLSVAASGRNIMRLVGIPIPALALAAPLIWDQGIRGNWLALLADPGAPVPHHPAPVAQLLLGFPSGSFGGWPELLPKLSMSPDIAAVAVPALLAPLAVLALLALFLPGRRNAGFALLAALLGFATAVLATHLELVHVGASAVAVWSGAGLSLYWLGIVGAAVCALRALRRHALIPALVATIALVYIAAPLAASVPLHTSAVAKGGERTLPAFVTAEARTDPRVGTLELTPQADGGIRATLVRGAAVTLDDQSTVYSTNARLSGSERRLAVLAGNLASRSGLDASADLGRFGIRFVLLRPADADQGATVASPAARVKEAATADRTATALDGNSALAPVGDTAFGRLWRTGSDGETGDAARIPADAGGTTGSVALLMAAVVIGIAVLLSIPTGAGGEAVRRANRETIRRAARADARATAREQARRRRKRDGRPTSGRRSRRQGADVDTQAPGPAPGAGPDPIEPPDSSERRETTPRREETTDAH